MAPPTFNFNSGWPALCLRAFNMYGSTIGRCLALTLSFSAGISVLRCSQDIHRAASILAAGFICENVGADATALLCGYGRGVTP